MPANFKQESIPLREVANEVCGLNEKVAENTSILQAYMGRNILINANFHADAVVNQRGFGGGIPANGVYGYDRWKGTATSSEIAQVVEAGNYKPSSTYTLSGVNVVTTQTTSPASGHWQIDVPASADLIQLELGSHATEFENKLPAETLLNCKRFFRISESTGQAAEFAHDMRATPTESGAGPYQYDAEL